VRMIRGVLESRGEIGGQMGAGPHPGWHSSLYMTGVVMASLVEALEAEEEAGGDKDALLALLCALHAHFMRDDVELWPVALGRSPRASWKPCDVAAFSVFALRIYPAMGRWFGFSHPAVREGFAKLRPWLDADVESPDNWGRLSEQHVHPRAHDALMLGARVAADGQGVDLAPAFGPATLPWPVTQTVATPWGALSIAALETADRVILNFNAPADFRVRVETGTGAIETRSHGGIQISKNPCD
ncbi:MAG: hypothetical protein ACOYMV_09260, partial [Verrucomicrobiia bacterium]